MKVEAERCDNRSCRNIGIADPGVDLPYGWSRITLYTEGMEEETAVVCSRKCLMEWLKQPRGD